jgi:hypothetical protein
VKRASGKTFFCPGGISPRRNLNQSECNNQVMPDTMNEYEVGFEMDKI